MKINGIELTKHCRHCDSIIPSECKICTFCNKDTSYPIPKKLSKLSFSEIRKSINDAFFRIECFMNSTLDSYQYFGFEDAFTKIFFEVKKFENFTPDNCNLIGDYWRLCQRIRHDFETGEFENKDADKSEDFCNDCDEIIILAWDRIDEFCGIITPDEIENAEKKFSIADILKTNDSESKPMQKTPKQKGIIKAEDYISFYGLLSKFPVYWNFTKSKISKAEFIEQNPKYELNEYELEAMHSNERFSLSKYLELFKDETELVKVLRLLFDEYREQGGDPLTWLYFTFENVSLNPQSYPLQYRGVIEKNLIQWIDNFRKQPFDLLAENIKYLNAKDKGEDQNYFKIEAPAFALFCSIVHQSGLIEMGFDESYETYCQRISTHFAINANPKKARQFFTQSMEIKTNNKRLKKVIELILPNIPTEAKQKIETFLNNKTKMYG